MLPRIIIGWAHSGHLANGVPVSSWQAGESKLAHSPSFNCGPDAASNQGLSDTTMLQADSAVIANRANVAFHWVMIPCPSPVAAAA